MYFVGNGAKSLKEKEKRKINEDDGNKRSESFKVCDKDIKKEIRRS